jgi:hypothetical protein
LLNDPRVDPSARDNYARRAARNNSHHNVVELLLKDPRVGMPKRLRSGRLV